MDRICVCRFLKKGNRHEIFATKFHLKGKTMEAFETNEYENGYEAKIFIDEFPESPRQWDCFGKIIAWHPHYTLGEINLNRPTQHEINEEMGTPIVVLAIYCYEHSGITISTSNNQYPFNDIWDSGQVGFIYVDRETILKEFSVAKITKEIVEKAKSILQSEIEAYDTYLTGQIFGYEITKDGDFVDSCWFFYGQECMQEEIDSMIKWHVKDSKKLNNLMAL